MNRIWVLLIVLIPVQIVTSAAPFEYKRCNLGWNHVNHEHNEESYQKAWCEAHDGIMEYENPDFTRVDCLTKTHAVEFDFANKAYEGIGQCLHYGVLTNKKPMLILILDNPEKQIIYYRRVERIAKKYNFDVEYVTNDILELDESNKCSNPKCKCHRHN